MPKIYCYRFFTKLQANFAAQGKDLSGNLDDPPVEFAVEAMSHIAKDKITALMTPIALVDLVDRCECSRSPIDSAKSMIHNYSGNPDDEKKSTWHVLMPNQKIDDVSYTVLTNQSDLNRESDRMDHCIGGYAMMCRNGESHIISGSTKSGENFTLELRRVSFASDPESINGDKFIFINWLVLEIMIAQKKCKNQLRILYI